MAKQNEIDYKKIVESFQEQSVVGEVIEDKLNILSKEYSYQKDALRSSKQKNRDLKIEKEDVKSLITEQRLTAFSLIKLNQSCEQKRKLEARIKEIHEETEKFLILHNEDMTNLTTLYDNMNQDLKEDTLKKELTKNAIVNEQILQEIDNSKQILQALKYQEDTRDIPVDLGNLKLVIKLMKSIRSKEEIENMKKAKKHSEDLKNRLAELQSYKQ